MRSLLRAITACCVVVMTLFVLQAGPIRAQAASPGITLTPSSGPAGATVTVAGTAFTASTTYYVCFGGTLSTTTPSTLTSDTSGNFSATIVVPITAPGTYPVTIQTANTSCGASSAVATANFTVTSPATNLLICGPVTAFTAATTSAAGSVTISGLTVPIAAGTTVSGTLTTGASACVQFTLTGGNATAVLAGANLASSTVACGVYAAGTTAGTITLGSFTINLGTGASTANLVAGTYYCATLDTTGAATGFLTNVPTAITAPPLDVPNPSMRMGRWALEY
ncbi:MAG TPA: hypothetical protein VFB58_06980 [Chloroflexota bacterium]|nr:hypothetical protein [Chloroflexota bacterium]